MDRKNKEHDEKINVSYIIRLMDGLGWTESQAMDLFKIPEEERPMYEALVDAECAKQANAVTAPVAS